MLVGQEQALRTNSIKDSIDKTSQTPLCRLCGESTETVRHCQEAPRQCCPIGTLGDVY